MKYLVTFFWAFAIGQAVCYLGGALQSATYDFQLSTIVSLIIGVITVLLSFAMKPTHRSANH
ncbi:YjzD family protein [Enterococcus sp. AZ072]|uniref:YjzD family protein n=1 Tax=unclassified Enterococcus TaxID=2608891 RepID=UPI003D29755A